MADTRPGRDLVVCCDGTNNTLTAGLQDTNVLLLHAYLRKHVPPRHAALLRPRRRHARCARRRPI